MLYKTLLIFILSVFLNSGIFAQRKFEFDKDFGFRKHSKPTIDLSYGVSNITLSGFSPQIANTGSVELRLGFSSQRKSNFGSKILRYNNSYIFLSNSSNSLNNNSVNNEINSSLWRFGFGKKEGYGLKLGSVSVTPFNSNSFAWSQFNYDSLTSDPGISYNALYDFNDAFRFGSTTEGGLNLQFTPGFSIQPKFEISDIYPRHLFWKQSVSTIIEYSGLFLLNSFTRSIMKNAPVAGVFVNFILKNAYEYGFYQLRRNNMSWPYSGAAPLRYGTFKLGMTFTF